MNAVTRPALRYHGGKFKLAPWKRGKWPQVARLTHRAAALIAAVHVRLLEEAV